MRIHEGVTTLEEIRERIERLHGKPNRMWVMDRCMISDENVGTCRKPNGILLWGRPRAY
jgi:hypothetical protein